MTSHVLKTALATAVMLAAAPALAGPNTQSGTSSNGIKWTATSRIIGNVSSATIAGGGDPRYLGSAAKYRSTVGLLMEYSNGDAFVCSGSLLSDRKSIVTAGHCVSGGAGTTGPAKVTAYFYDGNPLDVPVYSPGAPGVTTVDVSRIIVNSQYTGQVIDQNDIAVLRLADLAPTYATGYELYLNELTGTDFNVAGYGRRSDTGGAVGANLGTGRLRQGENRYDFAWGDADFKGKFTSTDPTDPSCGPTDNFFCGSADIRYSYVSDFDNGLLRNDTGCLVSVFIGNVTPSAKFCDTGVGANEVGIAGGDSGGPGFVDGKLASVNSYGLSFGAFYGDVDTALNSSWGEFSGYVPIFIHKDFILAATSVPEPATWGLMILGFGMVGGAMRSRRAGTKVSFAA